jgi:hypothetical protein
LRCRQKYNKHSEPHSLEVLRELQVHWQKKKISFSLSLMKTVTYMLYDCILSGEQLSKTQL